MGRVTIAMVAVIATATGSARADDGGPLARARSAKQRVDYETALLEVEHALGAGDLSLDDTREALLLRGEFLAVLGRAAGATDAFVELLAIAPGSRIDPGLAPRVIEAFEAAARRAPAPVVVACKVTPRGTLAVSLEVGSSRRARLVRVERRQLGGSGRARDLVTPPAEMMLPRAASELACFAVDERGNALAAGPGWQRPLRWTPPGSPATSPAPIGADVDEEAPPRPILSWRSPWPWAGAAVVVGAAGATFHWLAQRDQERLDDIIDDSSAHTFTEAEEVLERGRSRTRWARGLYGGAAALAAVAVTFALLPDRRTAPDRRSARLSVGPAGVALSGEF